MHQSSIVIRQSSISWRFVSTAASLDRFPSEMFTKGDHRQRQGIVAGENPKLARRTRAYFSDLRNVTARFLYAQEVRYLCQTQLRIRQDVGAGSARDIVDDDRQIGGLR